MRGMAVLEKSIALAVYRQNGAWGTSRLTGAWLVRRSWRSTLFFSYVGSMRNQLSSIAASVYLLVRPLWLCHTSPLWCVFFVRDF